MSSFNICGFFQLKAGRRVSVSKPNSTYFTHYNTNVRCISNTTISTDLCGYVTSTAPLLPDGMVSFAFYGLRHDLNPAVILHIKVQSTLNQHSVCSSYPAKRRKFDHPSPSSAPGPSTSVSTSTSTFSHSYLSTVTASVPPVLDPISTGDPMYYYPQYFAGIPPALDLPAQSLPDAGLFSVQVAFPWSLPLQVKGIVWSDFRRYANRTSNSNVQDNSPFNRSPANTYSYPMTQIPSQKQSSVNSIAAPSNPPIQSNVHRIFDLIDFRDCVVKWTRPNLPHPHSPLGLD
ncbi:hypothetical protein B0H14DRAFT_3514746 [Mycena olivaceomarginata]|nr:hypothetical protein B0H14DRAFT_3514746 [Mycena olivaceomarginata]